MSRLSRRDLLKAGAQAAALAALPAGQWRPLLADWRGAGPAPLPPIEDSDVKALALRAVDAARAAGSSYADVRLTHTYNQGDSITEAMHVGVRALVNGYWGFAASPIWTLDEMDRLGQEAVHQAKVNAIGKPRPVVLASVPKVVDGHWTMPVKRDPFAMDRAEWHDVIEAIHMYINVWNKRHHGRAAASWVLRAWFEPTMQEKAFASTDGSFCTQRLYRSSGDGHIFGVARNNGLGARGSLDFLSPAGVGWELYRDHDLREALWQLFDELAADAQLPVVPLQVGRYDTVLDARAVAVILDRTLGRATELDRAMGYEANATGTSFITNPFGMVGNYQVGTPMLTVTADRSAPGGCATVQWDDEGVVPEEFALVKDGVLTDFQTTREGAGWLEETYTKQQRPVRSRGCAAAPVALNAPLTHTPNLVLKPGMEAQDFEALVGTLKNGIAVKSWGANLAVDMDFQNLNGLVRGGVLYQVRNGKRVARLGNAGMLIRAPDLWKGLLALGGADSARRYGLSATKGEPPQEMFHSVTAVPSVFKQLTLIDVSRKP